MGKNVVSIGGQSQWSQLPLTEEELTEMETMCVHPATVGHILFDHDSEILDSRDIDENAAHVFANVFDICEGLGSELGQDDHRVTVFESRGMEITCLRWTTTRFVWFRTKGGKK